MNVKELHSTVLEIREICKAAGAAKMAADLTDLCQIFSSHEQESVEEFLNHLRRLYATESNALRPPVDVDAEIVDRFVKLLRAVGNNQFEFDRVIEELRTDRSVGLGEANAIQHGYIGGREAWPTRKAAFDAIKKSFDRSRYQDAVLEDIKDVTPW